MLSNEQLKQIKNLINIVDDNIIIKEDIINIYQRFLEWKDNFNKLYDFNQINIENISTIPYLIDFIKFTFHEFKLCFININKNQLYQIFQNNNLNNNLNNKSNIIILKSKNNSNLWCIKKILNTWTEIGLSTLYFKPVNINKLLNTINNFDVLFLINDLYIFKILINNISNLNNCYNQLHINNNTLIQNILHHKLHKLTFNIYYYSSFIHQYININFNQLKNLINNLLKNNNLKLNILEYNEILSSSIIFKNDKHNIIWYNSLNIKEKNENNVVENNVVENNVVENNVVENNVVENNVIENNVVENNVIENNVIENDVVENDVVENDVEVENDVIENDVIENDVVEVEDKDIEVNKSSNVILYVDYDSSKNEIYHIDCNMSNTRGIYRLRL